MRVFIGVKIPAELQNHILTWQEKYKKLDVRFIKEKNLHITIVPPWYEENLNHLVKRLSKFRSSVSSLKLEFSKITVMPKSNPRLIQAEGKTTDDIVKLYQELMEYFKKPLEKREFKSHITVARLNKEQAKKLKDFSEIKINWSMIVSEITLFEAKLLSKGAEYEEIKTIELN